MQVFGLKLHRCTYTQQASFFSYTASIFENYLTVFQSDALWCPRKDFSHIVGSALQKRFNVYSGGTSKMLKKDCLMDEVNCQDLRKIDMGAGAHSTLKELNLSSEKAMKFKADCHDIIQSVILKFVENTSLKVQFCQNFISSFSKTCWK